MEKLLFYSNEWDDFKEFITYVDKLEKAGFEVAVATDNPELVRALSVGKLLVVNPKTYYYTIVVSNNKSFDGISFEDFKEVFL